MARIWAAFKMANREMCCCQREGELALADAGMGLGKIFQYRPARMAR
jgi:hypothetical protein